jgi:hypothetical protein
MAMILTWMLITAATVTSADAFPTAVSTPTITPALKLRDLTVPIKLCINKGFKECYLNQAPEGQCYNFPANLNKKVSSYLIPAKTGCTFYEKANCDVTGFAEWTADSDRDLRDLFNRKARNDLYSAMKCYHTP